MFHSDSEVRMSENMSTKDSLNDAAREGNIDLLYTLIQQDPDVLENIDKIPFVQTPLHVAVDAGDLKDADPHLQFAVEIMMLKPSFASKRNPQGLCPIHLALQSDLALQSEKRRMVHRFVEINKDLVRVKGREGITPLHLASQNGDVDLIEKFLEVCPDSIQEVTARSETALHVAVKYQQYEALKHLTQWLMENVSEGATELEKKILNWKDEKGNTILHISARNNDHEALRLLLKGNKFLELETKNLAEKTAFDIAGSEDIKNLLKDATKGNYSKMSDCAKAPRHLLDWAKARRIGNRRSLWNVSGKERNAYLVVATLIATATYQASLSPPGGLYQANPGTANTLSHLNTKDSSWNLKRNIGIGGNSVMTNLDFIIFSSTNMLSFFLSTFYILSLLPKKSIWLLRLTCLTGFLQASYLFSMMVISPTPVTSNFLVAVYVILAVIVLVDILFI